MTIKLFISAVFKMLLGLILIAGLLFLPAGTWDYPQAWLFLGILFIPMLAVGSVLMIKNPSLLEKRLKTKEKEREQGLVVRLSGLMFIGGFVVAALDYRFTWLPLPEAVSYIAAGVFLLAYGLYGEVLRENTYLSRTVEVQSGQQVIDTGLYAMIRHPMYSATVVMFLVIPLVLGSLLACIPFLCYPAILVQRIKNEEQLLEAELDGYRSYKQRVRYRLIPFVW